MISSVDNDWEPSESDLTWTTNLIGMMKQGGIWALQSCPSIYQLDHGSKNLTTVVNGDTNLHKRIVKVFSVLGWTVDSQD